MGPTDHVEPFHVSIRALGCELFPSEENSPPTAKQLHALVHVVPMRRLVSDGPVFGLVIMFHPEAVAPTVPGNAAVQTKATAIRAPTPKPKRRPRRFSPSLDIYFVSSPPPGP